MNALPQPYGEMKSAELVERIAERKKQLARRVCILGHHYQRDEVLQFADVVGDSLDLSRRAAEQTETTYIVFCGVHFMAESADILSAPEQIVCLPNFRAGCAMADMADEDAVAAALQEATDLSGPAQRILPITYVNSTAAIKALTGQAGGACCTSSNAAEVFQWALRDGGATKIFAIPDQHLGRNVALHLGYDEHQCVVYDPAQPNGGLTGKQVHRATFLLWKGFCYVHQVFRPEHVRAVRAADPDMKVIVHPECPREIVALADAMGSTSQILQTIGQAPAGGAWAVGTESHLVRRLARQYPDKTIRLLSETPAICAQMSRIDLPHLLWSLDAIAEGRPVNVVSVPQAVADDARIALQRMIDIKSRS